MDFDFSLLDWFIIRKILNSQLLKEEKVIAKTHERKLVDLELRNQFDSLAFIKKEANIDMSSSRITNLSSRTLTKIEIKVLEKGLKFGVKPKEINTYEILTHFEELAQNLNKIPIFSTPNRSKEVQIDDKQVFLHEYLL